MCRPFPWAGNGEAATGGLRQISGSPDLGERFAAAVAWALELHAGQVRKATRVPYASHLLAVAALVLGYGGGEDEAIAAVLHDSIEDTEATRTEIEERFGPRVAAIVEGCSDADGTPKAPWRERKERHLDHLRSAAVDPPTLLVAAADKLHNLQTLGADHRHLGDELWTRFNAGADDQLWYYRSITQIMSERLGGRIASDLEIELAALERIVEHR